MTLLFGFTSNTLMAAGFIAQPLAAAFFAVPMGGTMPFTIFAASI